MIELNKSSYVISKEVIYTLICGKFFLEGFLDMELMLVCEEIKKQVKSQNQTETTIDLWDKMDTLINEISELVERLK